MKNNRAGHVFSFVKANQGNLYPWGQIFRKCNT